MSILFIAPTPVEEFSKPNKGPMELLNSSGVMRFA
jgi:hypothetical protein